MTEVEILTARIAILQRQLRDAESVISLAQAMAAKLYSEDDDAHVGEEDWTELLAECAHFYEVVMKR